MTTSRLNQLFTPYEETPKSFQKLVVTVQVIVLLGALSILFFVTNLNILVALIALIATTLLLSLRGLVWPAQLFTPIAIAVVSTIFMLEGSGTHDTGVIGLLGSFVVAGLLLGVQGLIAFGLLGIGIFVGVGIAEVSGRFTPPVAATTTLQELFIGPLLFLAIMISLRTLIQRQRQIARRARENEQAQITANQELVQLKDSLESRIGERTAELERRAGQMEAIATTARSISNMQDLSQLLPTICRVVSERFGHYHTAIFLIDERSEYAILQAASSPGGQQMLQRGHRLRMGATGLVGHVAAEGEARIALDVGTDATFFSSPDLPATRSEIALPLKSGEQIIGVLDAQSEEVGAFRDEDIVILGILADQVAVAIENARLFSQTNQALADSQTIYQHYVKTDWARFARTLKHIGYSYDGIKAVPISEAPPETGQKALNILIKVRGLTIGNVIIRSNNPLRQWSQDEINLAQAAAERAGLAIENFRLLTEAQRRAIKERTIGEITSRISSSVDVRAIMQSAVEELGRTLAGSEVILQLESPEENPSPQNRMPS